MSCTTTAARSPTLTWHSQSPCDAGPCIMASTCSYPACWSLAWPCWCFCYLLTLEKRSLWVRRRGLKHTEESIYCSAAKLGSVSLISKRQYYFFFSNICWLKGREKKAFQEMTFTTPQALNALTRAWKWGSPSAQCKYPAVIWTRLSLKHESSCQWFTLAG